ncbi:hypothetical protein N3C_2371 [Clostridium sp. N3C]|uniref:hypothetical protein n=1 Tax=Clostridium sp. N3C TaxID=1776758 RepID=UPI00092DF4EC|nr:hypothetical protein [Clostridium sp. N3C]NLZ34724.1 hypothetical protein [Clostridiales bacterium]SCN25554.1 hypothetical protein N3C_2371 [Clostridium sp. N3C]
MKKGIKSKYILIGLGILLILSIVGKRIANIIVPLLFLIIILRELKAIKRLIVPTRKNYVEIIALLVSTGILIFIICFYAKTWIHYLTGVLGILLLISSWFKSGITAEGFTSMYKYENLLPWSEINKVILTFSEDIKVEVFGSFMEQSFYFKKKDYDKIISILKAYLPKKAKVETFYK